GTQSTRKGDIQTTGTFHPLPGLKVLDESRREVAPGQIGYLAAPSSASQYFRAPDATGRTYFTIDGVPYAQPGDLGRHSCSSPGRTLWPPPVAPGSTRLNSHE